MSRIACVNGRFTQHRDAAAPIGDRGYRFADAILNGIARRTVRAIAEKAGYTVVERNVTLLQAHDADHAGTA